jgi:hypothetical protein
MTRTRPFTVVVYGPNFGVGNLRVSWIGIRGSGFQILRPDHFFLNNLIPG